MDSEIEGWPKECIQESRGLRCTRTYLLFYTKWWADSLGL